MHAIAALVRAQWLTASSYKINTTFSFLGTLVSIIPIFFVSNALQPLMGDVIRGEGTQYFGFLLIGTITYGFLSVAVVTLPAAIASSLGNGTLELVLGSPTPIGTLLTGLVTYNYLWVGLRTAALLLAGALLGANIAWPQLPAALLILALIVLTYAMFGLVFAALYLVFRTTGPLPRGLLLLSSFLGGVYYPTHVIPSWLEHLSVVFPLTYGLRAMRRVVLDGAPLLEVSGDLGILLGFLVVLLLLGAWSFAAGLRHARQKGTLGYF